MSEELRPCPFCGGKAKVKAVKKDYIGFTVWCACNCGARTSGFCPDMSKEDDTIENIEESKNCEIPEKGFNVDHLHCLRNYENTEEFTGIDVHDISNLMPSCGSCNRYKATMDLKTFRQQLQKIPDRLKRDVCTYNIALRYGMVQENREPIKFYFEKVEEEHGN